MLSATNTLTDIKAILKNTYDYYGFANDTAYDTNLTLFVTEAKISDLYPVIGSSGYSTIQDKDKTNLTDYETYIYYAELYFSIARFTENYALYDVQNNSGTTNTLTVEGYSSTSTGASGYNQASLSYTLKAYEYLSLAGYAPLQLQRNGAYQIENPETKVFP